MKPIQRIKGRTKSAIRLALLKAANIAGIDLLDLAYRQMELYICGIGELEFLRYVLKPMLAGVIRPTILDVGANYGDYTNWILSIFSDVDVYGFEPNPPIFAAYSQRYLGDSRVHPRPIGLADEPGNFVLYHYTDERLSGHASLSADSLNCSAHAVTTTSVGVDTLDQLIFKSSNYGEASFIKLDIEGFELKALQGAFKLLENPALRAMQFEFNANNIHTKAFLKDFYDLLASEFQFFRLTSRGMVPLGSYSPRNEIFAYQNLICIRNAWAHFYLPKWP